MYLKCKSQNFLNAILGCAYSIYFNKVIILYGEASTGKSTLAHLIAEANPKFKLYPLAKNSKISKIENIIDKKEFIIFISNFNEWQAEAIEYFNSRISKINNCMMLSLSLPEIKEVHKFCAAYNLNLLDAQYIYIPALRERKEDLIMLAEDLINETSAKYKIALKQLSKSAKSFIYDYPWYGNFNEFNNVIKNAFFHSKGKYITEEDIQKHIKLQPELKNKAITDLNNYIREMIKKYSFAGFQENSKLYFTFMQEAEKILIDFSIKQTKNLKEAAKFLGISPNTFRKKYANLEG